MILKKFLHRKKYVMPFIDNLKNQYSMNNGVFFSDYNGKNFLIILCINDEIFEVTKNESNLSFFKIRIKEDNFTEWSNYKNKIITMKEQACSSSSKNIILLMSENIKNISNQSGLSFNDTKDIFSFLLRTNQSFFINNSIQLTENMANYWID